MAADDQYDGIFVGGPRDGSLLASDDEALVEVEIDGFIHRYVVTTKLRKQNGMSYTVYNYDGAIDPTGAQPGIETPDGGRHNPVDK
jgi:hypothetical protein